ncbi:PREDICTED: growth-regulating factor 9-like isoform X2 [Ipomoea nil]|uniref:growth-regulating factor 9-like isoform X2 n=1 Tax=Ipomoea nil TaxID=35883 RepID=UPI00090128A4|nr:PREDICTED: growth-regulating factor 9-like isoform X2 [Ipomoea nil]
MQTHSNSGIEKDGSPSVKLVLGYGHVKTEPKDREEEEEEEESSKCGFTEAQCHELYLQALIFKYIQCGLPVPFHLLLPIWRTVSTSFASNTTVFFTQQFSAFRDLNAWGFGDMSMMDPEPGRCRRTDGKKWRCSKSVVPHQKYCERHMHRGSNRSRKLVEASQIESKSHINPARPLNLEPKPKFLSSTATDNASPSIGLPSSGVNGHVDKHNSSSVHGVGPNLVRTIAPSDSHNIDGKYAMFNGVNTAKETNQISEKRNTCQSYVFVPGLGIFPKSGHEHGTGKGSSSSGIPRNRLAETELLRCNRSDGKKWRCKRASIPGHKYCEIHLHRGSKKITVPSNPVTVALPPPASMDRICPPLAIPTRYLDDGTSLNTNLSIAPASHQLVNCDSTHTSSSDSTTITDETPTFVMH